MIDQDQDGFIDADDLKEIFTSLGADPDDDFVNEMIAEAPGNFYKHIKLKPKHIRTAPASAPGLT